jgi:large subunit ribosomal protein L18
MKSLTSKERRAYRTRGRLRRPVDNGRLRLSVFRSAKYIYAQLIDDERGHTVAEANSKSIDTQGTKIELAHAVGKALAERALEQGVKRVVFDRGAYRYHGRVQALAEGAREGGLEF